MGLQGLSGDGKEVRTPYFGVAGRGRADDMQTFSTDINSPLKPPPQTKEGHPVGVNGRKASLSHGAGNAYGVTSPSSATRPGPRRRETLESNPFSAGAGPNSPSAAPRTSRDDPYWFARRGSELKESEPDDAEPEQGARDPSGKLPFGGLQRTNTAQSSFMGSIWQNSSQNTPPGGGFGNFALPGSSAVGDKRAAGGSSISRLAHLLPKDEDEVGVKAAEGQNPLNQQSWRARPRTDTDPFGDDGLSGSAALGGAQDEESSVPSQVSRVGTLGTPVKGSAGDFGMSSLGLGGEQGDSGPLSPSETNPYRSPAPAERQEHEEGDRSDKKSSGQEPAPGYGTLPRGFGASAFEGSDRSQTSSVGAKGFPLGMSGWPAPGLSSGTPDRDRPGFGNTFGSSLFNPGNDLQSPGLGNLHSVFGPASTGAIGTGSIGRGSSKLGSLFPAAMQAQMQSHEHDNMGDSSIDPRQVNPLGAIGRGNFGIPARDTESPMRSSRSGVFEELFPSMDPGRAHGNFGTSEAAQAGITPSQSFTPVSGGLPFGNLQAGNEPPSAQVRQMVMPDRMRWVYLDPQGHVQGPFTGLEMNDWYKANFFTPDLRVKKVEDSEFEPLGQLIRRIGNSREPFLVPQIGIAHGQPLQAGPFAPSSSGGVVPPLSGVFPSFGRTLTAEEQNNLERRKQEEQYLMAQQREFMMRQQHAMPKFPVPGPGLQHHSSAHSLQSQPSFGSMAAPGGVQQQQHQMGPIGPSPGYFDAAAQGGQGGGQSGVGLREEDFLNLSGQERQILAALQASGGNAAQAVAAAAAEAQLRGEMPLTDQLDEDDPEGFKERLREFEHLRAQHEAEQAAHLEQMEAADIDAANESPLADAAQLNKPGKASKKTFADDSSLSLAQQMQQAAATADISDPAEVGMPMPFPPPSSTTPLPAPTAQRARSNLPEQFNRSQTGTPDTGADVATQLPPLAPWAKDHGSEAQRGPSLKEIQEAEARKAAKAEEAAAAMRRAAMEHEVALMREKEKAATAAVSLPASSTWGQDTAAPAASPWGAKPTVAKGPAPGLSNAAVAASKKTLADIQREEELRKQRAREVSAQSGVPASAVLKSYANLAGKPGQPPLPAAQAQAQAQAQAAVAAGAAPATAAGWATVGAGGKVKIPSGPAAQNRSVSTGNVRPVAVAAVPKPVSRPAPVSAVGKAEGSVAMDEFNKWVYRELSRGITGVNDSKSPPHSFNHHHLSPLHLDMASQLIRHAVTIFQAALDVLPLDTGLIADAVYANSTTMDGRHFAEEFVRRKRLAEKGVVVDKQSAADAFSKAGASSSGSTGGWSEVAKKGGTPSSVGGQQPGASADAAMQGAGFKVVPSRKKGKK